MNSLPRPLPPFCASMLRHAAEPGAGIMNFFPAMGEGIRLRADVGAPMPRGGAAKTRAAWRIPCLSNDHRGNALR